LVSDDTGQREDSQDEDRSGYHVQFALTLRRRVSRAGRGTRVRDDRPFNPVENQLRSSSGLSLKTIAEGQLKTAARDMIIKRHGRKVGRKFVRRVESTIAAKQMNKLIHLDVSHRGAAGAL
jgi:hypothetical protein